MTKLLWICGIAALLFLGMQLRLGILAQWEKEKGKVHLRAGPLHILLYPRKKNPAKEQRKQEKKKAKAANAKQAKRKPPQSKKEKRELLRALLPALLEAAGQLRRKVRVDELTVHLRWGEPDPADAAMHYGDAWAAAGVLLSAAEASFVIVKRDVDIQLDYALEKPVLYARVGLSLTLWQLVYLAATTGVKAFKVYRAQQKKRAERAPQAAKPANEKKRAV